MHAQNVMRNHSLAMCVVRISHEIILLTDKRHSLIHTESFKVQINLENKLKIHTGESLPRMQPNYQFSAALAKKETIGMKTAMPPTNMIVCMRRWISTGLVRHEIA